MNTQKIFEIGLVCGRFGHEHLGHVTLISTSLSLCKRTLVLVGSAQEAKTLRNPFTLDTRIDVIRKTYPEIPEDRLIVQGLNDMTNEYDITDNWGRYVKQNVEKAMGGKFADLMVYGNDEFRSKWFAKEDIANTAEFVFPRKKMPISATMLRGYLLLNDEENWKTLTHPNIYSMYQSLRSELMEVPVYKEIYNLLLKNNDMSIDSFMKIYSKYEDDDKAQKIANLQ